MLPFYSCLKRTTHGPQLKRREASLELQAAAKAAAVASGDPVLLAKHQRDARDAEDKLAAQDAVKHTAARAPSARNRTRKTPAAADRQQMAASRRSLSLGLSLPLSLKS